MWELRPETDYMRQLKDFAKRYRRETQAVHDNLDTFLNALRDGSKPQQVRLGCIHPEPCGVLAFDEKGGGKGLKAIRLYVYPDEDSETLYLITLGDKNSQPKNIKYCREWVADFIKQKQVDINPNTTQSTTDEQ